MFISVIVPSYNHEPYLKDRIESIINQTYQNFEIILLDDVSPDNSAEILLSYKDHPKVSHCVINETNSGSTFSQWNKGMSLAKGELIWIAETDDVADFTFLETLVPQFEKNPNLTLAYCQSHRMNAEGVVTGDWKDYTDDLDPETFKSDFTMNGIEYLSKFLINRNTIPNASAVIFKRQIYLDMDGANENLKWIGDWSIWSKIITKGEIFFTSNKLNYFRYHNNSVIYKFMSNMNHIEVRDHIINFRLELSNILRRDKKNYYLDKLIYKNNKFLFEQLSRKISHSIRKNNYTNFKENYRLALKLCPRYFSFLYRLKVNLKLTYAKIIKNLTNN